MIYKHVGVVNLVHRWVELNRLQTEQNKMATKPQLVDKLWPVGCLDKDLQIAVRWAWWR